MVFEKVREILCDQLDIDPDEITLDTDIINDLGADSLDLVDFVMSLEDEFDKEIPDEEIYITFENGVYEVESERLINVVNSINFNDRESLMYFERSLNKEGIIDKLRARGCSEGDTVRMYGLEFDFID